MEAEILRNGEICLPNYTVSHSRRPH